MVLTLTVSFESLVNNRVALKERFWNVGGRGCSREPEELPNGRLVGEDEGGRLAGEETVCCGDKERPDVARMI